MSNMDHDRATWTQAVAALELARRDALEDVDSDDETMLLGMAQNTASNALLLTPAPDLEAVAVKLEVFVAEEGYNLVDECVLAYLNNILVDIRRLASGAGR